MDERARIAAVLCHLRELGVAELFLDGLTADEARRLLASAAARVRDQSPDAGPRPRPTSAQERTAGEPRTRTRPEQPPQSGAESRTHPGTRTSGERAGEGPLAALEAEARGCVKCRLSERRTQVVFGRGSPSARLVIVGEAPGGEEDRTGLPFVGRAGKLLDLLLLSVGFERGSVYICNVLKCRPPNNRDPQPDEVATCAPYLHAQLEAIQPAVLLALGKFAAQMLTGTETSIGRLRGRVHEYRGIPVVATYHPAYLLRSPHATRKTWQDLQLMRQVMDEHG
ncbi:MAG: uracil-DNA glycosylase family protein [Gemmatimonadota bacterium]